jgi:DNA-binding HxlR family transcriptional regulator
MKRKCLEHSECAVARALDAIGDWWSLLILREAFAGKRRFSEFQKSLGVARNILTARLKKLVAHGVFEQVPASDGSAFHEYALTERGRGLYIVLMALRQWGETCLYGDDGPKYQFVDAKSGKPIKRLELRSHNGKLLQPEDVRIVPLHGEPEAAPRGNLESVAE